MTTATATAFSNALKAGKIKKRHTSLTRGYISRKGGVKVEKYSGKFGEGFKVFTPNFESSRYCYVTYYTK